MAASLTRVEIEALLDTWLETEFTFHQVGPTARALCRLPRDEQDFVLDWIRRIATTHITLAFNFAKQAADLIKRFDRRVIEAWAIHLCDTYDRAGMYAALEVAQQVGHFIEQQTGHSAGALYEDYAPVLLNFLRGLSGRRLKIEQGQGTWTDGETIRLPAIVAPLPKREDNFRLAKALVTFQWAHTRYGSLRPDLTSIIAAYPDPQHALRQYHGLETLRLTPLLSRELPGLGREMAYLSTLLDPPLPFSWQELSEAQAVKGCSLEDSLARLDTAYRLPRFPQRCYQGELQPDAVAAARLARLEKEKARLRVRLAELAEDAHSHAQEAMRQDKQEGYDLLTEESNDRLDFQLTLDGAPVAPPDDVRQLLTSIHLDFGEVPPDYLVPAGDGEYDPSLYQDQPVDPDAVWQGTYHEEGALFYPEWDLGRQHYRKNWAVMREKEVKPIYDDLHRLTLDKYSGLVRSLRKSFEAMRDEDRLLKRQAHGDEVDIDALVEALADARDGREMSERLFTRMHRGERNIAVAFLVDMSGSTRGWINEAEKEALILLCEALQILGDRYAIYGFSGITRKRCELFRVKSFDESYGPEVLARISGIQPQEYTRMGFAIRHLTQLLATTEGRTRVLITLSDGRPDDYFDAYRGPYGIEDTRMALLEARRAGIHPFCITLDKEARDYLPHMYGPAHYIILDDVRQLPYKAADIYRRLTS